MGRHIDLPQEISPQLPLDDHIASSIRGVQALRDEVVRLTAQVEMLSRSNLTLEVENNGLRVQLESEKQERSYYHRFAVEIGTSLNMITAVCDDVTHKANEAAMHGNRHEGALPPIEFPKCVTSPLPEAANA